VDVPHRLSVAGKFFAQIHAWMLRTLPGSSHMVFESGHVRSLAREAKIRTALLGPGTLDRAPARADDDMRILGRSDED
jgi:hypothetical protein